MLNYRYALAAAVLSAGLFATPAKADGNIKNVNHIIVVMQENHSYDNYFGALAYAPGSVYHNGNGACSSTDNLCVDGLTCTVVGGALNCTNSNKDQNGVTDLSYHAPSRCTTPDLDHGWYGVHAQMNWSNPNSALTQPLNNGFVLDNDAVYGLTAGVQAVSYYTQADLPWYYTMAQTFAMSDRHFSSVLGPTFPNRSYFMAATSFGHVTTADSTPPLGGYKPITGTIFDLLDNNKVTWYDYYQDLPQDASFREISSHNKTLANFYSAAAGNSTMPSVAFVDPNFGTFNIANENDKHPPTDIQRGQYFVWQVVNAVRNGPYWKDSIIIITHDEHGGYYDHVAPPAAPQGGARTPDGIYPGQCEDASKPPGSEKPGGGKNCSSNSSSSTDTSVKDAEQLCPALANNPTGPYPSSCAAFDQLGLRVPFVVISPFAKPHYVSHTAGDHTAILNLIEQRFLSSAHLTARDQNAAAPLDMFDFTNSPSLNTTIPAATPPAVDCTP